MDDENVSEDYKKRRAEFVERVFRFHERRGMPLKRLPMLGGRELNIYHLYEEVQKRGGSEKVTKVRMWGEIARTFNLPSTVTSASYAIRNHFIRLLEQFEAYENGVDIGGEVGCPSPSSSLPPPSSLLPSLPKPLQLFKKPMALGTALSLPPPPPPPPSETTPSGGDVGVSRLTRSLLSGLPNEVDFAINILLILSHSNALTIKKIPSLLDVILAHVAIFSEDDPGLESMYREAWYPDNKLDFFTFWETTVPEWIFSIILNAPIKKSLYECVLFNRSSLLLRGEGGVEVGGTSGEEEGVEGARVAQVATILSNFSSNESSVEVLAQHSGVVRFLVLGMLCDLPSVSVPALDCLANLAYCLKLDCDPDDVESPDHALVASLHHCILSEDRFAVKRGIEIFGRLSWSLSNSPLFFSTPSQVYHRLLHSLLLPDTEMIIIALESLYNLSLTHREIAEQIAAVRGFVDSLVCLLAFRIESLPPESLARIKLFFVGDSKSLAQYLTDIQAKATTPSVTSSATPSSKGVVKGVMASPLVTNQIQSKPIVLSRAISPLSTNQISSRSHVTTGSGKSQIGSLHSILSGQSQTGSQNTPKEEFAIEWLKQSYEAQSTQHLVLLVDMYAQYVLYCSSKGKRDFLNNAEFMKALRQVFPATQLREVQTVAKKVIHFLTGLRRIPLSQKTTNNHAPISISTATTTTTSSALLANSSANSSSVTPKTTATTVVGPHSSVGGSPVASFGRHSSSVSLQSSSVGSFGSSVTPPPSLSHSHSPSNSLPSSAVSSRDSSPALRTSPDSEVVVEPTTTDQTSRKGTKTDQTRTPAVPATMSPTDAHYSRHKSNGVESASDASTVDRNQTRSVSPASNSSSTADHREQPVATLAELGTQNSTSGVAGPGGQISNLGGKISNSLTSSDSSAEVKSSTSDTSRLHNSVPQRPVIGGRSLKGGVVLNDIHDLKNWAESKGGNNSLYQSLTSDSQFEEKKKSVEPALDASAMSSVDQIRQRSLTPNSTDIVPEAKRIRLSSPVNNIKQQTTTTQQTSLTQPQHQLSLIPTTEHQQTRQTSYTTSTIQFVNNSPTNNSNSTTSDSSNKTVTGSGSPVRPVCLWENCMSMRYSWRDLFHHAVTCHLSSLPPHTLSSCHWAGCSNIPLRRKQSLIHHIETHHCSPGPSPIPPSAAATLAKLRHCPPLETEVESPLTKAVRVTAALVLRNLCKMSPATHTHLRRHEYRLSEVALSSGEAANTIAECLNYLTLPPSPPSPLSPSHHHTHTLSSTNE